jgi:hypothetical protein
MPEELADAEGPAMRKLLHNVNDELSIAVMQLEMMLENGSMEAQLREALEESLEACRKAADGLRQIWTILGPRHS